jgi:hypothetical protein
MTHKKGIVIAGIAFALGLLLALGAASLQGGSADPQTALAQPVGEDEGQEQAPQKVLHQVVKGASQPSSPSQGGGVVIVDSSDEDAEPEEPVDEDADDDGYSDDADNCPNVANADQADFDGDGLGDACDADDDNDNLSDAAEGGHGTNPYDKDTDGDGWYDGNEVNAGTDPTDPADYPEFEWCFGC